MLTDPIADFLTRLRNGAGARKETVDVPSSKIKVHLAEILQQEGFIKGHRMVKDERGHDVIRITLKYDSHKVNAITGVERVSKPGYRKYVRAEAIPPTMNGLGIAILTTSRGVMSDRTAQEKGVGGELICRVW
jgi:small subunit ribosomal protein S8